MENRQNDFVVFDVADVRIIVIVKIIVTLVPAANTSFDWLLERRWLLLLLEMRSSSLHPFFLYSH